MAAGALRIALATAWIAGSMGFAQAASTSIELDFDQTLDRIIQSGTRTAYFYVETGDAQAQLTGLLRQLRPYHLGLAAAMPVRASEGSEIVDAVAGEIAQIGVETVIVHAPEQRRAELAEAVRKHLPNAALIVMAES